MAKIKFGRDVLSKALDRSNLNADDKLKVTELLRQGDGKGPAYAEVAELPLAFLKSLLDDVRLSPNQRAVVAMRIHGMTGKGSPNSEVYQTYVGGPVEFGSVFVGLGTNGPNCEVFLNGRWYPITLRVEFIKGENNTSRLVELRAQLSICDTVEHIWLPISKSLFMDDSGKRYERTVLDVLHHFGFRKLQTPPADFNLKLVRAERIAAEAGRVVTVAGPVLVPSEYFWMKGMESRSLGTEESPRKGIVEPELEVCQNDRAYYAPYAQNDDTATRLPFVRVFSLDFKNYVYVDVADLAEYEFDTAAMSRLHLPEKMLSILTRVFDTPIAEVFGDLIEGKHGGVVILACGGPGVGKTLTAEVYAEQTQRPLYVLELGELGTDAGRVEENLRRVFTRVARWNAVLQFDECEIFLTERGEDLERSAIVGIFLRLLDYYQGILFLTTNRPEALDSAVLSRVMLKLDYPDLDIDSRAVIWETMFKAASLELTEGSFTALAEAHVNGRQIRNLTRLAKILHPGGKLTLIEMREVLKYGTADVHLRAPRRTKGEASHEHSGTNHSDAHHVDPHRHSSRPTLPR